MNAVPPANGAQVSPEPLLSLLLPQLCQAYDGWPETDEATASLVSWWEGLESAQREVLRELPAGRLAAEACPQTIPPEAITTEGRLPLWVSTHPPLPGTFDPTQVQSPEEDRVRYEWTAVGLGCLGLGSSQSDAALRAQADQLLSSMGYSLEQYVAASLALDDRDLSDRVFRRLVECAGRHGARPLE